MGKKKKRLQNKTGNCYDKIHAVKGNKEKYTVKEILDKVEEHIGSLNFEDAEIFCSHALEMAPNNLHALTLSASVFLEIGRSDEAVDCLKRAIDIEPDKGHRKYMMFGELLEGDEAVECFKKGIQLMITEKEINDRETSQGSSVGESETAKITNRDISNAYCSVAELYLTDCCFSENAEKCCEEYCKKAVDKDETNPEAYQVMGNFLLSAQKNEEAKVMLLKSLNLWTSCEDSNQKAIAPSYESRISLSKMLIEVEEYDNACQVLEGLLQEDDEVVQVWYLLGWAYRLGGKDHTAVKYYLEKAQHLFKQMDCDDEPLLEHIKELLSEIDKQDLDPDQYSENQDEVDLMDITT